MVGALPPWSPGLQFRVVRWSLEQTEFKGISDRKVCNASVACELHSLLMLSV